MRFTDARSSSTHPNNRQLRADGYGRGTDDVRSDGPSCPGPLIVVSNRQPYRHEYEEAVSATDTKVPPDVSEDGERQTDSSVSESAAETADRSITVDEPTGGLTAGLDPVLQRAEGTWIAWGDGDADFAVADEHNRVAVPPDEEAYTLQRIDLSDEAVDSYYYGFSNRVLWPLCHGFTDLVENRPNDFEWYRTVNERFAEAVSEHATADSVVWLQDYHFALAPRMIRESVPRSTTVAQFWHIPWPSAATFQRCPVGVRVLEGLLGNDLLGFHIDRYADRFLDCVQRYLPAADVDRERRIVRYDGETTRVVATPMGVDAESYDRDARSVSASQLSSLFDRYDIQRENVIGLGVDRLDYSKGIPERLAAIERFLERNPAWHGEFAFVQTATPSRTDIRAYEKHGELVRSEAERINRRFGTREWDPIVYTEDHISAADLCALYRRADLMVVSPLVDGMNLVAQEYVAASIDGDGTLVLSEGTGAHETLGSHALTIDPTDIDGFARQIETAVSMPSDERQHRMNTLRKRVLEGDLEWWMETQFDWIRRVHGDGPARGPDSDLRREFDERTDRDSDPDSNAGSNTGSDTDTNSDSYFDPHERTPQL
ncbi:alpha,alpha-trehalose-phosphate synthase (UDP-forming) [Natronorubrum halophilum]|uniref:alpha,alpha-trehalose-phosphate synthase (UDP-forming) n=1 Tax=Natronorubrum halophilum TaxID=1702106 RepID=UPI0010C1605C|nr:trehalose-6-phosphate synthase [Natronorubrum halophilum]